ncbi:MAG: hemolysin III family protein [Bowdeniella nasicola]|nr:hemolysin III family protein [Bowdeniella nasicola]
MVNRVELVKPRLRGMIHAVTAPLTVIISIALFILASGAKAKVSIVVFGLSALILFGHSAIYHRGTWSTRMAAAMRRIDHSNIFLLIAGTYTPLSVLLLDRPTARLVLVLVWGGAIIGILLRVFWLNAPRWLYVPLYIALGWVAVWFLPQFSAAGRPAIVWLVIAGGIIYTLGAVVYATRWPDPSPRWFGFHEIFHLCTVGGYACHAIAVFLALTVTS